LKLVRLKLPVHLTPAPPGTLIDIRTPPTHVVGYDRRITVLAPNGRRSQPPCLKSCKTSVCWSCPFRSFFPLLSHTFLSSFFHPHDDQIPLLLSPLIQRHDASLAPNKQRNKTTSDTLVNRATPCVAWSVGWCCCGIFPNHSEVNRPLPYPRGFSFTTFFHQNLLTRTKIVSRPSQSGPIPTR